MKIVTVSFEGKQERAVEVEFESEKEGWSSYRLPDGTVIKLKNVVARIFRLLDRQKDDGSPFYVLEGQALVTTIVPSPETEEQVNAAV